MIFEQLKTKIEEAMYIEIKNSMYAQHLNMIDTLVNAIKKEKPDFNPDNLVTKLSEMAEKCAEQEANMMLSFKKEVSAIVCAELGSHKQVQVTA